MDWLSDSTKEEIQRIFSPKYKRKLTDEEISEIAENLEAVIEELLKLKWRQKYGISKP